MYKMWTSDQKKRDMTLFFVAGGEFACKEFFFLLFRFFILYLRSTRGNNCMLSLMFVKPIEVKL